MSEPVTANGHCLDAQVLRQRLIAWGRVHWRSFPWRTTQDPYRILIAEFMLLRTQARQVTPIYEQFLDRYPTLGDLARASRSDVHGVLYPLGLRWRADYVLDTAIEIEQRFDGEVPDSGEFLRSLPGVSQYIASAVLCFAYGKAEPLVDTNTVRVTGRLFGLEIKDSSRRSKRFQDLIAALVDQGKPRRYNFALLDLAALVCTKRQAPDCPACPLQPMCLYGNKTAAG